MSVLRSIFELFKETLVGWSQNEATLRAAALAYYTIFSMAPLLILSVVIASQVFTTAAVEGRIVEVLQEYIGIESAVYIEEIIKNGYNLYTTGVAAGVSIIVLLVGASTLFAQLQAALNAMWGITPRAGSVRHSIMVTLQGRLLSAVFVIATGFLVIFSLLLSTIWGALPKQYVEALSPHVEGFLPFLRLLVSPVFYMLLFASIFKALPQAKIRWSDVWPGALVTALLFWMGSYVLGQVLSRSIIASVYGAASSFIVILLWIYYATWIVLFGAKFTHVYAERYGEPIQPYNGMVLKSEPQADGSDSPQ